MVKKIAFIGAGSITEAMILGILKNEYLTSEQIFVTNKENDQRRKELSEKFNVHCTKDPKTLLTNADIILFTVKPTDLELVIDSFKEYIRPEQLVISVLAGVSTEEIEKQLEQENPVIRSMPNTSAMIGYSATAITPGTFAEDVHIEKALTLFNTIGKTTVVHEEQMDTVTGISGSGPAYIYYLVEAMEKAAIAHGLDEETANFLITQTIIGAGKMLEAVDDSPKTLRENVTSPNGTTEAAIQTLSSFQFQRAMEEGIKRAIERSIELGNK